MSSQQKENVGIQKKDILHVLAIKVVQNIFFPETYNASTFLSLNSRCAVDQRAAKLW